MKLLFGIGGLVLVIGLPIMLVLPLLDHLTGNVSVFESNITSSPKTNEPTRWFKRDSDAEEVLELVYDGNAYAFEYEGGILWATIYQADGQVLFSNVGRRRDPSFKLSDHCGRLLVIVTDDREIKVFDPITHVEKLLDEVAVKRSQTIKAHYTPLKLAPPQSDAANSLEGGGLLATKDYACILWGDSLSMELRWADEELELDAEIKNQIWWDIERSRDEKRAAYMQIKRSRDKKRPAYVHMAAVQSAYARMLHSRMAEVQRIANGYGIAYEQAKTIHDQGKTAEWRTETPPGGETETPATVRPTL
ncbi:hypothetical protein N9250_01030 [bacterium]|nr:hypothetical protein [bacterium]